MMLKLSIIVLTAVICQVYCKNDRPDVRLNRYIYFHLQKGGEPNTRPVKQPSDAVNVEVGIAPVRVNQFNAITGQIQIYGWLKLKWFDANIAWTPSRFGGLNKTNLPVDKFWVPDIKLYNNWNAKTDIDMTALAIAYNDGSVLWIPPVTMDSMCDKLDNGTWECSLKFGSWTYNGMELNLSTEGFGAEIDLSDVEKVPLGYYPYNPSAERVVKTYDCCPEPYQHMLFKFLLEKNSS